MVVWLVADCGLLTYQPTQNYKRVVTLQISTNTAINYTTCYSQYFFIMENQEIIFEGVKIKPTKTGIWKCPFGCHTDNRFAAPKWKTEKGFMRHLENCYMRPSAVEKRNNEKKKKNNEQIERNNVLETLKSEYINTLPYNIGDEICYVKKIVVKDTHEWRGNRSVKVRYEPVLRFDAIKTNVSSINFKEPDIIPTIENMNRFVYFNNGIKISDIMKYEDAVKIAKEKTIADEQYRHESSMLR